VVGVGNVLVDVLHRVVLPVHALSGSESEVNDERDCSRDGDEVVYNTFGLYCVSIISACARLTKRTSWTRLLRI
jgi:hypothetical protein